MEPDCSHACAHSAVVEMGKVKAPYVCIGSAKSTCSANLQCSIINSAHMRERVTVVSLSVSLSTSDFEDDGVFWFETGINVN